MATASTTIISRTLLGTDKNFANEETTATEEIITPRLSPRHADLLEDRATKLSKRLGHDLLDFSFRDFCELIRTVSAEDATKLEAKLESNLKDISDLVDRDILPYNRKCSVLRKVYFSSLNRWHKIREDPPVSTVQSFMAQSIESFREYDDSMDESLSEKDNEAVVSYHQRDESTTSWSSLSEVAYMDKNSAELWKGWADEQNKKNTPMQQPVLPFALLKPTNVIETTTSTDTEETSDLFSSFQFVSPSFDDESAADDATAVAANHHEVCSNHANERDDDSSLLVFFHPEATVERRRALTFPSNSSSNQKIDLPQDFEVVTILSKPIDPLASPGCNNPSSQTYSITTTRSNSASPSTTIDKPKRLSNSGRSCSGGAVAALRKLMHLPYKD